MNADAVIDGEFLVQSAMLAQIKVNLIMLILR